MKKYQKYSLELKQEILNRFNNGESAVKLAKEYNLSTYILIYQWSNKGIQISNCGLTNKNKKDIEIQFLKEQLKLKDKQLKLKEKELQKEQLRGEFLKKHIPFDKKFCQREMIKILNSKYIKLKACEYILEYKIVYSIKFMCEFLPITRQSYYRWLSSRKNIKFKNYRDADIKNAIASFYQVFKIKTGANEIRKYVINNLKYQVSIHKVRKLHKEVVGIIPWKTGKNVYKFKYKDRHENYIHPDYIENNYQTTEKYQKLGMDATIFNECTVKNKKSKLFFEIIYDLYDKSIVSWNTDFSENKHLIAKTLLDLIEKTKNLKTKIYIQTDRGRANCSKLIQIIEDGNNITISMSNAVFKHNAPTEALHRWVKEKFYLTNGKNFNSYKELITKFNQFAINWNKLKTYKTASV